MIKRFCSINLFKVFLIIGVYFLIVNFLSKSEYIRSNYSDYSFSLVNLLLLKEPKLQTNTPKVFVVHFNDKFLEIKKLVNKYNEPTYGYIFPREYIADFIKRLDNRIKRVGFGPKALFIDYDFSYTSMPLNQGLSKGDKELIRVLAKDRKYTIYIPRISSYNFIANSKNKELKKLIKEKKIVFVTPKLYVNNDGDIRRYKPFDVIDGKKYENIVVELYEKNNGVKLKGNNSLSIYDSNILFKDFSNIKNKFNILESYWSNIYKISVIDFFYLPRRFEDLNNSIVFLGSSYKHNSDKYTLFSFPLTLELNGVDVLANAYQTISFFNGFLKVYGIKNFLVILFLVLIVNCLENLEIFKRLKQIKEIECKNIFCKIGMKVANTILSKAFIIGIFFFFASIMCLLYCRVWVDFLVLLISYKLVDFFAKLIKERK